MCVRLVFVSTTGGGGALAVALTEATPDGLDAKRANCHKLGYTYTRACHCTSLASHPIVLNSKPLEGWHFDDHRRVGAQCRGILHVANPNQAEILVSS